MATYPNTTVAKWLETVGLDYNEAGRLLGIKARTVYSLATGRKKPQPWTLMLMTAIAEGHRHQPWASGE